MSERKAMDGVVVVDKPCGPTSHDVVSQVRRLLQTKAGHTGTLDPLATGVLPLVLGQATRLSQYLQGMDKEYRAVIRLGRTTDTGDREGETLQEQPLTPVTDSEARRILSRFQGEIEQRAPLYSAVKVKGKRLYKLARQGKKPERPLRRVKIHSIELLQRSAERWTVLVNCSAGTYIRTLAEDVGEELGCGAHIEDLRRTRSGPFALEHSVPLEDVASNWEKAFVPMQELLPELPALELDSAQAARVRHGNEVILPNRLPSGLCRLLHRGRLLALADCNGISARPRTVFK